MKKLIFFFSLIAVISFSSFTATGDEVNEAPTVSILVGPSQDVFSPVAQQFIVATVSRATDGQEHPCSGSCVCDPWTQSGTMYYRTCGCFTWGFWYESKPCYYCVASPGYGQSCLYW